MRIAVAGNQGSFSQQAGELYAQAHQLGEVEFNFALDSAGVFLALQNKQADIGIMPIFNQTGGLVEMTLAAMGKNEFIVTATFDMPVQQCLLALPTVRPDEIRTIASHPQALAQCQNYINTQWSDSVTQDYSDTAQAAADLAAGKLASETTAVLAPKLCAELYGLRVVAENIQDDKENKTYFIVIKSSLPLKGEGQEGGV